MDQVAPPALLIGLVLVGAAAAMVLVARAVPDLLGLRRRWVARHDDVDASTLVANLHRLADLVPAPAPAAATEDDADIDDTEDVDDVEDIEVVVHLGAPPRTVDVTPTRPRHSAHRCASHQGSLLR